MPHSTSLVLIYYQQKPFICTQWSIEFHWNYSINRHVEWIYRDGFIQPCNDIVPVLQITICSDNLLTSFQFSVCTLHLWSVSNTFFYLQLSLAFYNVVVLLYTSIGTINFMGLSFFFIFFKLINITDLILRISNGIQQYNKSMSSLEEKFSVFGILVCLLLEKFLNLLKRTSSIFKLLSNTVKSLAVQWFSDQLFGQSSTWTFPNRIFFFAVEKYLICI